MTGSLRAGLAADYLLLDMNRPEIIPSWDFEWELVRYYGRDQIGVVVVDGKPVLHDGQPVDWDLDSFIASNASTVRAAVETAGLVRVHGSSALHRPRASD